MEPRNTGSMNNFFEEIKKGFKEGFDLLETRFEERLKVLEKRIDDLRQNPLEQHSIGITETNPLQQAEVPAIIENSSDGIGQNKAVSLYPGFNKRRNGYDDIVKHLESEYQWFPEYIFKENGVRTKAQIRNQWSNQIKKNYVLTKPDKYRTLSKSKLHFRFSKEESYNQIPYKREIDKILIFYHTEKAREHLKANEMVEFLKEDKFYWENMQISAEKAVLKCIICKEQYFINLPKIKRTPLIIETHNRLEIVQIDLVCGGFIKMHVPNLSLQQKITFLG